MKIFRFAIAPVLAAVTFAFPATAEMLSLNQLSAYLNSLGTVRADFVQTNDDGSRSNGVVTIKRPGRIRLEYAAPNDSLVLGSGGQVAIFDSGSNEPPQRFPMSQTPLGLILADNINLGTANMVTSHRENGSDTVVRVQDPAHPEYGAMDLYFSPTPVLKGWTIYDENGGTTRIQLTRMALGGGVNNGVFNIRNEASRRGTPLQ